MCCMDYFRLGNNERFKLVCRVRSLGKSRLRNGLDIVVLCKHRNLPLASREKLKNSYGC